MAFVEEIDKRAARALAPLTDGPAALNGAVEQLMVILGPARPVLQALVTRREKFPIHARRIVALLDQLELHVAGIGQRYRQMDVVMALLLIPEAVQRQFFGDVPWADPADLDPMAHRLVDIAHHEPHLPQRPEQSAHRRSFLAQMPYLGGSTGLIAASIASSVGSILSRPEEP